MKEILSIAFALILVQVCFCQCDTPQANVTDIDCSVVNSDIISGGSVNSGQIKYLQTNSPSNISVGSGGILYICSDITLSLGSGPGLLSPNGGTIVIPSCVTVTLNAQASPTYLNSGSEIINYGKLIINTTGSHTRFDNGAKLFNYGILDASGAYFLRNGSIINDNDGNYSRIETILMRTGFGGSAVYALGSSKLCLAENSCLNNNVIVNGLTSNWLTYGGGLSGANLYGTTNLTGNSGSISNQSQISVCTTDNDGSWGGANYAPTVSNVNLCSSCIEIGPCTSILPVELVFFQSEQDEERIKLDWSTLTEKNNDYFQILKLLDNQWEEIGRIDGVGNSTQRIEYQFMDENPSSGLNYYRLQQFDLDGQFSYSNISMTDFRSDDIKVHPNPSDGLVVVSLPKFAYDLNLQVIDARGRVIHDVNYYHTREINLNLFQLKGVYQVRITVGDNSYVQRIILN